MLRLGPIPLNSSSRQCCQRMCHFAESPYKSRGVRLQSKEASHIMHALRFGPLNDYPNLVRRGLNSTRANLKTKLIYLVFQKLTFVQSPVQFGLPELLQGPPKVLPVLLQVLAKHQDIAEVYCNEFIDVISEDLIHQPLERGRCITQPKRHDEKLKMASVSTKSYFLYRCLFHCNLVIARCKV